MGDHQIVGIISSGPIRRANANVSGGGFAKNEKTGKMERLKNQSLTSKEVLPFYNNMEEFIPVNLIIGQTNGYAQTSTKLTLVQGPRTHIRRPRCHIGITSQDPQW